jgi:predicted ATPase/DNA-binding XRE family transcriptional regulator
MEETQTFGYWLKRKRKALDLTQADLAGRVGCSAAAIRKIEAEERRPSVQIAEQLAKIFDILPKDRVAFIKFARGDQRSNSIEVAEEIAWQDSDASSRSTIPAPSTPLIGREIETVALQQAIIGAETRLMTLIGPPGVGKTRLSLEVARAVQPYFPDGVYFVALAPINDADFILPTIAQTLNLIETKIRSPLEQLTDGIANRRILLVLDNLEHLIDRSAMLIAELIASCPRLVILTTSREALRLPGEWLYPVPVLDVPSAIELQTVDIHALSHFSALQLFSLRARAVRPDFTLGRHNIEEVAAICSKVDGLPLAIELIAARIRLMSPRSLLAYMNDQFILHADGRRAPSPRQKTLHNAIAWSYSLLSEQEQRFFARLSVFAGSFALDSAEELFTGILPAQSAANLITSLFDKSLLQRIPGDQGEPRFYMLVTIRQFAAERLREWDEEDMMRRHHQAYYLALAEKADREIRGANQIAWIDRLDVEQDNYRAALDWCLQVMDAEGGICLLSALNWGWKIRGHSIEACDWFEKLRSLPGISAHPALFARLLNQMGLQYWLLGDFATAQSNLDESRAGWQKLGEADGPGMAEALLYSGMVARTGEGDNRKAQSLFEQSFDLYQKSGETWGKAFVLFNLGTVADDLGRNELALARYKQSLEAFRQLGDLWGMGRPYQLIGQLHLKLGDLEKARLCFEQHLQIDEKLKFNQGIIIALMNLGDLFRQKGDYDQAELFYQKSVTLCYRHNMMLDRGMNFYCLGMLALQRGEYRKARQYFNDYYTTNSVIFSDAMVTSDVCISMAAVAAGRRQAKRAARLYGAFQAQFESIDIPYTPFDWAIFERLIQVARSQLGEAAFEELSDEGRRMPTDQVIVYALEIADRAESGDG